MRFLHLADVHLDSGIASRSPAVRDALRRASRSALERAVTLAVDTGVHAVLVAGDLFDDAHLSFETEGALLDQLQRLREAGIAAFYATGNHDPGRAGLRAHAIEWPDNVVLFRDGEPRREPVRDAAGDVVGWVTAAGHETASETRNLAARFPTPAGEAPEVALLHAQVVGSRDGEAHGPYAEAERDLLRRAGYDYWALGHVHRRQTVAEDPPIHYPGNLQGRDPRESGAKGALLVDLSDRDAPEVSFHPLAPIRWERVRVDDLEGRRTLRALEGRIARAWDEAREGDGGTAGTDWIGRFELVGPSPLHRELVRREEVEVLERRLAGRLDLVTAEVRADRVHPPVTVDEHRPRRDVLGAALELVERASRDRDVRMELRPDTLAEVVEGAVEDEADYLAELLTEIEGELVTRLLDEVPEP